MKGKSWLSPLLIGLAITFQIGVVASMAISREWILATGKPYLFQTAPVDPRDIFRGDYVSLSYRFSRVPASMIDEDIRQSGLRKGQKVYLWIGTDINGVAQGERLSATPPRDRPYLTGRSTTDWPSRYYRRQTPEQRRKASLWPVSVKYGIEQYYVEQGSGRAIEKMRGSRTTFQVPMLVHVGVSASGAAVIRSYEWSTLATRTEVIRSPERDAPDEQASAVIRFTLQNRSDHPITLPLKAGNCSFELLSEPQGGRVPVEFAGKRSECEGAPVQAITLSPEQTHGVSFNLNRPNWYVLQNGKPTPIGRLSWGYRFRIRYDGGPIAGVRGEILSRAFTGRGNID